ncbi:hypothetical protein Chor_011744 [Crotalus horridus]
MPTVPPRLKHCLRRPLGVLLARPAALLALTYLAGGSHEELSRTLLLLLPPSAGDTPFSLPPPSAFLLSPPPCAAPALWLLVLVASAPGHVARWAAVQQSWGVARLGGGCGLRVLFALGLPAKAGLQAALECEAAEHGDLLQGHFADTSTTAVLAPTPHLPLVPVEDAFGGLCARHAGITPHHLAHLAGFDCFPSDAYCYQEVLFSAHHVMAAQMLAMAATPEPSCTAWQRLLGLAHCKLLSWLSLVAEERDDP